MSTSNIITAFELINFDLDDSVSMDLTVFLPVCMEQRHKTSKYRQITVLE